MLIVINVDNKMNMKHDNVRMIRIILDLLELESGRGVIQNMETIY